jgi:predicted DNA-binding transcriptional regulator AlpA
MSQGTSKSLLTPQEAAEYCKMSTSTLAKRRLAGLGPRYLKIGRSVRYDQVELEVFLDGCRRSSTSEP